MREEAAALMLGVAFTPYVVSRWRGEAQEDEVAQMTGAATDWMMTKRKSRRVAIRD